MEQIDGRDKIGIEDFDVICRFCLTRLEYSEQVTHLYDTHGTSVNPRLLSIISSCLGFLDIQPTDGLPQILCSNCTTKLFQINEFRNLCISSVDYLQHMLRKSNKLTSGTLVELEIEQNDFNENSESIVLILKENGELIEENAYENTDTAASNGNSEFKVTLKPDSDHDYCVDKNLTKNDETTKVANLPEIEKLNDSASCVALTAKPEKRNKEKQICLNNKLKNLVCTSLKQKPQNRQTKDLCNICGALHTHTNMRRHIETHLGTGRKHPYACTICDRKFINRFSYVTHVNRHNNVRPFKCDLCPKSFYGPNLLRTHMNSHSTENKYACSDCNKVFRYPHYLSQHRRIHKANALYTCDMCDYTNVYLHNYKNHMRKHTGQYRFTCEICEKGFLKRNQFEKHVKKHQQ